MNDELLDIVDEHDQVIGKKYRSEIYAQKLKNFRVINAFLLNSKNQVWIPRRSAHKKLFPLCLDVSVGGHVMAGESYDQAFEREAREELNIEVANFSYKMLTKLTPFHHHVSAFMHLYIILTDETPEYNKDDFVSADWCAIANVMSSIERGEKAKSDLPILLNVVQKLLSTL